ncbi:hypothetical protein [Zarconia navalis]|nr:hypothetical protein [Zarconia navalis]
MLIYIQCDRLKYAAIGKDISQGEKPPKGFYLSLKAFSSEDF